MRGRLRLLAGIVTIVTVSGASVAVADERVTGRLTGDDPAHAAGQDGSAEPAAPVPVPLPDLGIAHRLADGGMNIFRIPLSELEEGYGEPQLVRRLPASQGWRYDRSVVLTGDFGNITAGDDGTADHVIWHATADGSIKVWAIGGGSDTAPRLWHTLPRRSGWNWSHTRVVVGDVDADGWDDLVVRHGATRDIIWVLRSDGRRLRPPVKWMTDPYYAFPTSRDFLADLDADGGADLVVASKPPYTNRVHYTGLNSWLAGSARVRSSIYSGNYVHWTLGTTRTLSGYFDADDIVDLVSVVKQEYLPGIELHRHLAWNPPSSIPGFTFPYPQQAQVLAAADGWSFAESRQYVADTNGDFLDDLVAVHRGGGGGFLVWRQVNDGTAFGAPELIADLRTGGWRWALAREGVADTWGLFE